MQVSSTCMMLEGSRRSTFSRHTLQPASLQQVLLLRPINVFAPVIATAMLMRIIFFAPILSATSPMGMLSNAEIGLGCSQGVQDLGL